MSQYAGFCGEQLFQLPDGLFWEWKSIPLSVKLDDNEKVQVDIGGCCGYSQALDEGMLIVECGGALYGLHSPNIGLDDRFGLER